MAEDDQAARGRITQKGGNQLEQDNTRQTTMQGNNGGLHPVVDRQCLGEVKRSEGQFVCLLVA